MTENPAKQASAWLQRRSMHHAEHGPATHARICICCGKAEPLPFLDSCLATIRDQCHAPGAASRADPPNRHRFLPNAGETATPRANPAQARPQRAKLLSPCAHRELAERAAGIARAGTTTRTRRQKMVDAPQL